MDKGTLVMVRSTLNQPIIRRLWSENDEKAVICRDESFIKWEKMKVAPKGVEVPKKNVFAYDLELFEQMKRYDNVLDTNPQELEQLWEKARPIF